LKDLTAASVPAAILSSVTTPHQVLSDVQSLADHRQIPIQLVGVRDIRHPLIWRFTEPESTPDLPTVGEWSLAVALPANQKGTHMSRFMAMLNENVEPFSQMILNTFFSQMLQRLDAQSGELKVSFPLFILKTAPVSGLKSLMEYGFEYHIKGTAKELKALLTLSVPVTSLCPCSKEISEYGAHNQRSVIRVSVHPNQELSLHGLVAAIEGQGSSQLYGLLKRADEKYVTEQAYDNPKFVEDLVRDIAIAVKAFPNVAGYKVEAENLESIHRHSVFAVVSENLVA
jgi:GTP cyclohydrolase IB